MKQDVYSKITDQIIAELEKGVRPWHKPWAAGQRATDFLHGLQPAPEAHPESRGKPASAGPERRAFAELAP